MLALAAAYAVAAARAPRAAAPRPLRAAGAARRRRRRPVRAVDPRLGARRRRSCTCCCRPRDVPFGELLGAFLAAQVVGPGEPRPGGLGVFETLMVLALAPYLPRALGAAGPAAVPPRLLPAAAGRSRSACWWSRMRASAATTSRGSGARSASRITGASPRGCSPRSPSWPAAVLLFSGATPSAPGPRRLALGLPAAAARSSSAISSAASSALGLLLVSRGVWRRLDAAYYLPRAGLGLGIVASLLKGGDYEEAALLALLLLAFAPSRPAFDRRAALLRAAVLAPGWLLAVVAVVAASVWLGFFSFKHVEYSPRPVVEVRARRRRAALPARLGRRRWWGCWPSASRGCVRPAPPGAAAPLGRRSWPSAERVIAGQDSTLAAARADARQGAAVRRRAARGSSCTASRGATGSRSATRWGREALRRALVRRFLEPLRRLRRPARLLPGRRRSRCTSTPTSGSPSSSSARRRGCRSRGFSLEGAGAQAAPQRPAPGVEREGASFRIVSREEVGAELLPELRAVSDDWLARARRLREGLLARASSRRATCAASRSRWSSRAAASWPSRRCGRCRARSRAVRRPDAPPAQSAPKYAMELLFAQLHAVGAASRATSGSTSAWRRCRASRPRRSPRCGRGSGGSSTAAARPSTTSRGCARSRRSSTRCGSRATSRTPAALSLPRRDGRRLGPGRRGLLEDLPMIPRTTMTAFNCRCACAVALLACALAHAAAGVREPAQAQHRAQVQPPARTQETFAFAPFGTVHVYAPAGTPDQVVLFVSGDGGWNLGVDPDGDAGCRPRARSSSGIDIRALPRRASSPGGLVRVPRGQPGAARARRAAAAAPARVPRADPRRLLLRRDARLRRARAGPAETFRGAISLGFCTDLELRTPLCPGRGLASRPLPKGVGRDLEPFPALGVPWAVLQGEIDQVCAPAGTARFVAQVGSAPGSSRCRRSATASPSPRAGSRSTSTRTGARRSSHGRSARRRPRLTCRGGGRARRPRPRRGARDERGGGDLWPSCSPATAAGRDRQGGRGAPRGRRRPGVVGWNSLKYYWTPRTPEAAARRPRAHPRRTTCASGAPARVLLAGYSFGADVLPFLVNRLPPELRSRVGARRLLGLSRDATFEFHVSGLDRRRARRVPDGARGRPAAPAPVLCLRGEDEADSAAGLRSPPAEVRVLPGGHHFGGGYDASPTRW